jgi:hypothetical protein
MLKLTIERQENKPTLTLEGKLSGQWVGELDRCWREELRGVPASSITVHLRSIAYVNSEGKALLQRIARAGTRIEGTGCMTRALVDAIVKSAGMPREDSTTMDLPRKILGIVLLAAALLSATVAFAQEEPEQKRTARAAARLAWQRNMQARDRVAITAGEMNFQGLKTKVA